MTETTETPRSTRLTVIVPAYNEIATIGSILQRVRAQRVEGVDISVVVVDDCSTDGTREFLESHPDLYDVFLKNPRNLGKGGSVKHALESTESDYVLFQDADLEYDPSDYRELLIPVQQFGADIVIGSRFLAPRWTRVFYFYHKIGNQLITTWFNLLYNTTWTDVYSCYLLYRRDLVDPGKLRTMRWEQQAEILGKACRKGSVFFEVCINYNGRSFAEGKKIHWYHTFLVLSTMLRVRLFG